MRNQKSYLSFLLFMAAMALVAGSVHWWLPKVLGFVDTNTSVIQGLADFIQIGIWVGILGVFVARKYTKLPNKREHEKRVYSSQTATPDTLERYSVDAKRITGFVQGENNNVKIHFSDKSTMEDES